MHGYIPYILALYGGVPDAWSVSDRVLYRFSVFVFEDEHKR